MEDFVANNEALILICHKGEVRPGWLREMDRRACALAQLLDKVRYLVWKGKCMWDFYDDIKKYEDCGILKKDTLYEALQAAANQTPEKVAVIDKDKALRFCDLMSEIDQYAEYFAGLGLKKGQRVVLQMPNKNLFVIVLFALVKIGVKPAMMLPAQRTIDVLAIGNMIEAVAYISVSDYMGYDYSEVIAPIENEIPTLKYILIEGMGKWKGDSDKWKDLTKLTEKSQPQELAGYRDTALYLLSGGTTGVPKIIPKMQQAYVYNAKAVAKRCEFDGSDVYMAVLPISHDLALANPGILGTLEMLLETSCKGAVVNLEDIPRNESVEWVDWLRSYPGSGFVFTAEEDKCDYIKEYLAKYSIEANVVGEVTETNALYLNYGDEQAEVFNQEKNPVFIFR